MARTRRPDWGPRFLELFAATGNVLLAARGAGVTRAAPYKRAQASPTFAAAWTRAREDAIDVLEGEARRRALSVSDTLLMFLLRAHRPTMYRDNARLEVTGAAGGPIQTQVLSGMADHEKAALRKAIDELLTEEKE
jgi:hypothetical protein